MILCLQQTTYILKKFLDGTIPKNKQLYTIISDDGVKYDFYFHIFIFLF